eukprot:8691771-Pyramimonas_sp.AAC.1
MRALVHATGARALAIDMCEWGLAPPDEPQHRHQKRTWFAAMDAEARALEEKLASKVARAG